MIDTKTEVLVIGAGSIGVNSAHFLTERGFKVTLLDKDDVCSSTSWGNAGLLVPSHSLPLASPGVISQGIRWMFDSKSPFYIKPRFNLSLWLWLWKFRTACTAKHQREGAVVLREISEKSMELYNSFDDLADFEFHLERKGIIFLYATQDGYQHGIEDIGLLRDIGLEVVDMDRNQVAEKLGGVDTSAIAGTYFPGDAHLAPADFVKGLASKAKSVGVEIKTDTQVKSFERKGKKIVAANTNHGMIYADQFVLAAGSWSPEIANTLGLNIPIQPAKGYSVSYQRPEKSLNMPVMLSEAKTAVTPMGNILRVGGTLELVGMDLSINQKRVDALVQAAKTFFPKIEFDSLPMIKTWAGLRPTTPDGLPLVGRPKGFDNLVIAAGHSMMGISTGPGTGLLVAQEINEEKQFMPTEMFDPNRFN